MLCKTGEYRNSTKLTGMDEYRMRVGDFRVLYTKNDQALTILVVKIGPRGDIYHD